MQDKKQCFCGCVIYNSQKRFRSRERKQGTAINCHGTLDTIILRPHTDSFIYPVTTCLSNRIVCHVDIFSQDKMTNPFIFSGRFRLPNADIKSSNLQLFRPYANTTVFRMFYYLNKILHNFSFLIETRRFHAIFLKMCLTLRHF